MRLLTVEMQESRPTNDTYVWLLAAAGVFVAGTLLDAFVVSEGDLSVGLLTYVAVFVAYHILAFAAIHLYSSFFKYLVILVAATITIVAFYFFPEWYAGPTVLAFLVIYTWALTAFLKLELR